MSLRSKVLPPLLLILILLCLPSSLYLITAQETTDNHNNSNNSNFEEDAQLVMNAVNVFDARNVTQINCTSEIAESCLEENRLCYQDTCFACRSGFVAWPKTATHDNVTANEIEVAYQAAYQSGQWIERTFCLAIQDLTLALFERLFQPLYLESTSGENPDNSAQQANATRLQRLQQLAEFVAQQNRNPDAPYLLGLNKYAADTPDEAARLAGYVAPSDGSSILTYLVSAIFEEILGSALELPAKIDWVEEGAVTSVKEQGRCGCCWAISVAGAIEGAAAIQNGYLQSLSFQQLASCDESNYGCDGGFPASALVYASKNKFGGMTTLNDYPFQDGRSGETTSECVVKDKQVSVESKKGVAITFYGSVGDNTFDERLARMKQGVASQPVAIAVKSQCNLFQNYRSGVITEDDDCACRPSDESCLDHAVLLVGYDDTAEIPFWKIKNSWGTGWGEDGYIRIAQLNPYAPDPNSWGLFGLLAEGVVPLEAFNQTAQVYDEPQFLYEPWEKWVFGIGVALAGVVLAVCCICGYKRCCASQKYDEPPEQ